MAATLTSLSSLCAVSIGGLDSDAEGASLSSLPSSSGFSGLGGDFSLVGPVALVRVREQDLGGEGER